MGMVGMALKACTGHGDHTKQMSFVLANLTERDALQSALPPCESRMHLGYLLGVLGMAWSCCWPATTLAAGSQEKDSSLPSYQPIAAHQIKSSYNHATFLQLPMLADCTWLGTRSCCVHQKLSLHIQFRAIAIRLHSPSATQRNSHIWPD